MRRVQYREWCPRESPLRIEIAEDLLRGLRPQPEQLETQGTLYGRRHGNDIRILAAAPSQGGTPLGIFVCRERGEVFLTEPNLGFMESQHAPLALVIAGNRAGFFVHAPEGAIQSVRSYEEFSIADPKPVAAPVAHAPARLWPGTWRGAVAGWLALIALPVAALAYLRPAFPGKSAASVLQVQEDRGLLRIRWQAGEPGILEIQDGADRLVTPVFANQSGAAYERHSRDVGVSLIRVDGGSTRRESTRFVGGPLPAAAVDQLRSEISQIKARARHLRSQSTARAARILALEKAIEQNTAQHTAP